MMIDVCQWRVSIGLYVCRYQCYQHQEEKTDITMSGNNENSEYTESLSCVATISLFTSIYCFASFTLW